jgi:SAM-dependent methyltransferase
VLDGESIGWLDSDSGQEAMAQAESMDPSEESFLLVAQRLARRWPEPLARAAVEQAILRRRARAKFPRATEMLFLREALEQSTGHRVAEYHARRLAGLAPQFDLGCGIGGDALALAGNGPVVAIDLDPLRLHVLRANARALGLGGSRLRLLQGDLFRPGWRLPPRAGVFADPGRRRHGRRVHTPAAYEPPLSHLAGLAGKVAGMGIKVSPGIDRRETDELGAEVEFVSEDGDLKECVMWFGALRTTASRATLLPGGHSIDGVEAPGEQVSPILGYLCEPDPAVLRAGLVRRLAGQLGASQIDPQLALLTADRPIVSPFVATSRVVEVLPFSEKSLRAELRRRGVGRVTLKKRGSAVDTEALGRRLRLAGEAEATVLLTRVQGKPLAIILEPTT